MARSPLILLSLCAACAHQAQTVSLRLDANVDEASVTVDDQLLGSAAFVEKRGVALPVGQHRVTVERPGYFPYDELVEAKEGQAPIVLKVELEKVPD